MNMRIKQQIGLLLLLPILAFGMKLPSVQQRNLNHDLIEAVEKDDPELVRALLNKGADVNAKNETFKQTALMLAAGNGHINVVKLLLKNDAHVNAKDEGGRTALMSAVSGGHKDIVALLLENKADVNARDDEYGNTALIKATEKGFTNIVKLLLDKNADVNAKNNQGRTALMEAAEYNKIDIATLLLENKADVNAKDSRVGFTPLILAAQKGFAGIVKLLLDKGADVNAKTKNGRTALIGVVFLVRKENPEVLSLINLLLDKGADVNAKENDKTPFIFAAERGWKNTVKLLLEYKISPQKIGGYFTLLPAELSKHLEQKYLPYAISREAIEETLKSKEIESDMKELIKDELAKRK